MNEAFFQLAEEKQLRIINAAMEVFAQYEYKKASTDDIAAKAGISKGLLFYYFHNKKELYLYLFCYSKKIVTQQITEGEYKHSTDFFELLEYGARQKSSLLVQNPYIMDFAMRAYYSENEVISEELKKEITSAMSGIYKEYFSRINYQKFRKGVDPVYLMQMLIWMTDGYLHEKQREGLPINLEEVMEDFRKWAAMFRKISYKKEREQ